MKFKVSVIQLDCVIGDVDANLAKIERYAELAKTQDAKFAVFPELGTTGYFVGDRLNDLAETVPGKTTEKLGKIAKKTDLYLLGGMIERGEKGELFNSLVMLSPEGKLVANYHKVHMFSVEKEMFTPGDKGVIVDTEFGRVALTVCYDLVFPEYVRSLALQGTQLILNGTDWITNQSQTTLGWNGEVVSRMAATRALENGIHLAMANRVGVEDGWKSLGHSCICAPSGGFLGRIEDGEGIVTAEMDLQSEVWEEWRKVATYIPDRRVNLYKELEKGTNL